MMPVTVDDIMNETPEDYAIRTAIPLQQAQTPAGAATQGIAFDELPDETYVRATSGSNKPEDQFDPLASLRSIVQPVLDNGQLGAAQITRGTTGVQALLGQVEYEAVKDDANARSMQALTLATQKADEGLWALDPRKFINATAQALPFLGATIGAGLAGAAGGAAVGAGAGLLGGPFAEVTVPGGALALAKIGYDAGSASFSAAVMGGQTYMDLRDAGLSHETSRVGGIAAGIVMGAIERLQLHQLTGIGRKAVADQLATPAGKRALLQIVREGATVYGQEIAEEEAQEVAGILTQVIGSVAEGNSDAMPKLYDPAKPDDPNTILNRLKNTLVQTAYAVPGLAATSHVAGVATGKAVSAALGPTKTEVNTKGAQVAPVAAAVQKAKVGVSTVAEALALIKEGFAKPAPTAEAIKQTKEATMADTLDALVKPGVDEKGKVVQTETGPQIQASVTKEAPAPTEPAKPTLETKGRETNVKDTLKTIDAAINDAERALISATADEKPTAAIRNKLDTLYAKRGVAQLELEQLAAGVATDVSGADITIKADRITALRAKAAKDAIKKFQQGVREGSKTARDTVKLVQAEVDSLIRASDLPAKDKGKFLARLRSITTEAQLTRALPEIKQRLDALIEKDAMRSAKRDLKRVLKQASERKAKRPEGKYTADVQTILDTYTQMIADPAKVEAALNVENPTGEREQLNKLIAEQVGDLENKNSDGVQRLADEIRSVIETGKSKRIEKTIAAKLEAQALIADVTTSINGDKPVDSPSMTTSKLRLKKWGENWLLKLDRAAGRFISTWADLMDIISQNDKTHAMVELMDVFPTIVEEEANQRKQFDAAIETLVDAVDPKPGESRKKTRQRVLNRLVEGGARVQDFGTFTDPDGREANLVVTRNEAAAIYAQSFDPDAAAGWDATYTRPEQVLSGQVSTLELLEKSLDDLDKQLVQGVINHFDGYHARINAAWEDETGATLPKNPFYSGQLRRVLENGEIEVVTAFDDYAAQSSLKPGSTIKRTKNANPLAPTDLYVNMFRQLHETEHWLAWRKTAKRLNVLRKNSKVRNTIKLKYGAGMLRTIDLHIDNMLQTKIKANEEAHKWLRHFRHNAGTAFVGGKALSAAKQFSSVLLFADYVSVPGYIAGVVDFFANPLDLKRKIKILESSEHLKSRNTTMDVSTMDMIQSTDTKQFKTGMRFTDFLMLPVKFGDKATIWAGGWSVYAETLKKTKSHDQAIAAFERAFNATQSSGTTDQQTQLEASGEFGKAISLFTKNSVQIVNMERKALRRAIAQPSAKNVYHAAKTLAITRFSQILFQLASATPYIAGGDEDKIEEQLYKLFRAAMFGAWTGLPLIGDVLDSAGTVMTNITFDAKENIWTLEFLPLEAAGDALTAFKNAAENLLADGQHNWDKIVGDGLSTWVLVAPKAAGGGLPVAPLWSAAKEFLFPEDDTGGDAPNLK